MVFFDVSATIKGNDLAIDLDKVREREEDELPFGDVDDTPVIRKFVKSDLGDMNEQLGYACGLDENLSVGIYGGKDMQLQLLMGCRLERVSLEECKKFVANYIKDFTKCESVEINVQREIKAKEVKSLEKKAESLGIARYSGRLEYELNTDFFNNSTFKVKELCYTKELGHKESINKAKKALADETFLEELERIYKGSSIKKFYGHPVHYKVVVQEQSAAQSVIDILIPALKSNGRLLSSRVTWISNINERCYDEEDIRNIFHNGQGGTVIIDMSGNGHERSNFATAYEEVIQFFKEQINEYKLTTLCIFIENSKTPGFSNALIGELQKDIDMVEIKDGRGDTDKAIEYFLDLTKDCDYPATREEAKKLIPQKQVYTASEVGAIYRTWFSQSLKNRIYTAYKACDMVKVEEVKKDSDPYKELQKMISLTEVKALVDDILNTARAQKLRDELGMDKFKQSMHMIFTGNPGSAKTTVARLIGQILKKEGILKTGNYVECGRADLVGKFVGWTAQIVSQKFYDARGGILFIDEAYSLVSDDDYGDEAINTIVQEMENHRDDVIVIFAGYPEKMKKFLDRNEGLRSRIAFHLNFKDYNAEEMLDILKLMAKDKGFKLSGDVDEKCLGIFKDACSHEEFGNGRFARNLLEQAIMRQSKRVVSENKGKTVTKAKLSTLKAVDFETNAGNQYKEKKAGIGFVN